MEKDQRTNSDHEWNIQELIVVEGKNDAHAVRRALGKVDVIWTEGFGLTEEKLKYISEMAKRRGVILCTDPDYAGKLIRERIQSRIPDVRHVYLSREVARNKKGDDIGLENVSPEDIRIAFSKVLTEKNSGNLQEIKEDKKEYPDSINRKDLLEHGLAGQEGSAAKRLALGRILGIGDTNAKQFLYRMNRFGVNRKDFMEALRSVERMDE